MPRGDKSSYTDKQKRKAEHIEEGYEKRGLSEKESERRAWATVNKMDGGGRKSGSGRGKAENKEPARKGGRAAAKKRSDSSKSGASSTRKRSTSSKTTGAKSANTRKRSSD
jgi:plasmid stabilization system protein ParE